MESKSTTEIKEVKTKIATRVPPGDQWCPADNHTLTLSSLTDVLEYIYQKQGNTQFYMDAREGAVYVVDTEEIEIPIDVIPEKKWSLYGE